MITIDEIIDFLEEKPGYSKESPKRLQARVCKYYGDTTTWNDCKNALSIFRKRLKNKNTSENKVNENFDKNSSNKGYEEHLKSIGLTKEDVKSVKYWQTVSGEQRYSVVAKQTNIIDEDELKKIKEDFINDLKSYALDYPTIERESISDPNLLVIDIADLHIGKLSSDSETGEGYNVEIAIRRALEGVESILQKTSGFHFDKILLPIGNDILHTDTPGRTTTSGTPQDTDGMWHDNFVIARKLYVHIIEHLVKTADVHVVHCPSNHDYQSGFMLAQAVFCWFNKHDNVTFDVSNNHRKYFKYGNNLIGLSHGDGAKPVDMPLLMANEAKMDWATTDYRYIYLHHVHHKQVTKFESAKDYMGVTLEYLRSPSSPDSWHHRNGYVKSQKAIEAFVHSSTGGQIARISHNFK